jgi:uncharacterized damage-inducible protein DinB
METPVSQLNASNRTATAAAIAVLAACAASLGVVGPAGAQQHDHHHAAPPAEGLRAELIQDMDAMAQKYLALLDVMAPHMDWRPADGVRSTRELFAHVAAGNFMIANLGGVALPEGMTMEDVRAMGGATDAEEIRDHLGHSFRHMAHGIAGVANETLDDPVTLFGRDTTRRGALLLLTTHAHEHLGQAIAYARVNGVTPPWSGGD